MNRLPHWVLTSKRPAFYDSESGSSIEQTAKVYGAMNELIDEYNKFVDNVNKNIDDFENGVITDNETFAVGLRQEFQDFIDVIELKMNDAENFMKANLQQSADKYLADIIGQLRNDMETFAIDRERYETAFIEQNKNISQQNLVLSNAITAMENRLLQQDNIVSEAVSYMNTNLETNVTQAVNTLIDNGEIAIGTQYIDENEELNIVARNVGVPTDLVLGYDEATETITIKEEGV